MQGRIGFIGMGIMGDPMARNLLKAGFDVTVYNRDQTKTAPLAQAGAKVAATPKELTDQTDIIIAMLTGPEALFETVFGGSGAGDALGPGKVFINTSTVSPSFAKQLRVQVESLGARYIDAPVSGSKKPAEEGQLIFLAGGPKDLVDTLEPLFMAMGKKVVYCGAAGSGSMMKMTVNLLLGVMAEGLAEAVSFGEKGGLKLDAILDVILSGPMSCGLFKLKEDMLRQNAYPAQFPLKHMLKDLKFVSDTAYETGAAIPAASAILLLYRTAMAHGLGDEDFAAVRKTLQEMG